MEEDPRTAGQILLTASPTSRLDFDRLNRPSTRNVPMQDDATVREKTSLKLAFRVAQVAEYRSVWRVVADL